MSRIVIVTGLSGAGKTQALRSLEDLGYYCVDNLPPALIPQIAELCAQTAQRINNIALVMDIRGGRFFLDLSEILDGLRRADVNFQVLFLEARDDVLVRRYKESRRRHPLGNRGEILGNIQEERNLLHEIRARADTIIDTSEMKPKLLKERIAHLFGGPGAELPLLVTMMSFGFKHGLPLDSDLVMDVRFLTNPFYDPALRPLTGNDPDVRDFVLNDAETAVFIEKFTDLLEFLLPRYLKEGKTSLTIAIGCTGGMHRSVALANVLAERLKGNDYRVTVRHRDIGRV